jgi:hypothetical protein
MHVSSVMISPKNVEIRNVMTKYLLKKTKTTTSTTTTTESREMEQHLWKDTAMHDGDNSSFEMNFYYLILFKMRRKISIFPCRQQSMQCQSVAFF